MKILRINLIFQCLMYKKMYGSINEISKSKLHQHVQLTLLRTKSLLLLRNPARVPRLFSNIEFQPRLKFRPILAETGIVAETEA